MGNLEFKNGKMVYVRDMNENIERIGDELREINSSLESLENTIKQLLRGF